MGGFSDAEIVALSGAHTVGKCHAARSGYAGPWTAHPQKFNNEYFVGLLSDWTSFENENGNAQYRPASGYGTRMLPSDMALVEDQSFREHVQAYADDQSLFFRNFATAFEKL